MSMVDSRSVASTPERQRRNIRPIVYSCVVLSVFAGTVITMAFEDGASGAVMTAFLAVAVAVTAVGVWGTAMAVKETENLDSGAED